MNISQSFQAVQEVCNHVSKTIDELANSIVPYRKYQYHTKRIAIRKKWLGGKYGKINKI